MGLNAINKFILGGKWADVNRPIAGPTHEKVLPMGDVYDAEEFLDTASYSHVLRWARAILEREAVQQGLAASRSFVPFI
ncbi:MAG: hypothetical protein DRQ59_08210 [Gammaproteobacteria bacterium]|nr:MAG: hypothetical protein DRQ59_08210 [Gammaproteobacteria bacterium]RLA41048.1 MAG: hypothetical protein DRR06_16555 [Gammaproteobacteria bacterium]